MSPSAAPKPRPRRIAEAERELIGRPPNLGTFQAAAHEAAQGGRSARRPQHQRRLPPRHRARHGHPRAGERRSHERRIERDKMDRPCRSSGWRTRRWSPAAAASPATSTSRASFTCGSCAPTTPTPTSFRSTPKRRGRFPAWSRSGPRPTSPTCRRSTSAKGRSRSSRPTASRCWRWTGCAMSASRWRRCSPTIPMLPRTPPISSPWRSRNCRCCSTPVTIPASSRSAATPRPRS